MSDVTPSSGAEAETPPQEAEALVWERKWREAESVREAAVARADAAEAAVERLKAEKAAIRKAAVDYCWERYKGRQPMMLSHEAVFTSHEWEKIGEAMDAALATMGAQNK